MGILDVPARLKAKGITSVSPFLQTAPSPLIVRGIDPVDDRLFAIDNSTNLAMSTDQGATYSNSKGLPANVSGSTVTKVTRWGAYLYLLGYNSSTARVELYRATPAPVLNDALTWSASLLQLTAGSTGTFARQIAGSSWGDARDALIVQDYGPDPTGGPSMWRSTDGTTWTKVLGPISATRHFHDVWPDPYRQGHWWMTCGDGTGHQFYRSTDYGVTWTKLTTGAGGVDLTAAAWQAVTITADATAIYFMGDSGHYTLFKLRRSDLDVGVLKPIIAPSYHQHLRLPVGRPSRGPFTDGATTSGSKNFTSATAAFTSDDVGKLIAFTSSVNPGGYPSILRFWITAVTNSTTVVLNSSGQANATASGISFVISGDVLYHGAFYGAVDPATGVIYQYANDTSSSGNRGGLFATLPDGRQILLESWGPAFSAELFLYQGYVYCGRMKRPMLTIGDWAT